MPVSKFKFVSPGVQVAEIDNSQLPEIGGQMGPVIFGRAERGPALRPVRVESFSEFVQIFGNPKGGGDGNDVWRNGGTGLAPTYGVYAAQAYLRNSNPVTYVRLLGRQHPDAAAGGEAGWCPRTEAGDCGTVSTTNNRSGGAYGLFVIDSSGSTVTECASASFELWVTGTAIGTPHGIIEENITIDLTDCQGRTVTHRTAFDNPPSFPTSSTLYAVDLSAQAPTPTVQHYLHRLTESVNRARFDVSSSITSSFGQAGTTPGFGMSGSIFLSQSFCGGGSNCNSAFGGTLFPQNVTASDPLMHPWEQGSTFGPFAGGVTASPTADANLGSLAAIFYLTTGSMLLRGVDQDDQGSGDVPISGTCTFVRQSANGLFQMDIMDTQGATVPSETISFDLYNESSKNYVRKVFNTNPTLTNFDITPTGNARKTYWLGESYNRMSLGPNRGRFEGSDSALLGILLPMMSGTANQQSVHLEDAAKAITPHIISQDIGGTIATYDSQRLFQCVTLEPGEWEQQNFKVAITNIKASTDPYNPYGTFTVELRMAADSDNAVQIVEQYSLCNLNPNSNNYVAKKIGDMFAVWGDRDRRYREFGNYSNQSKYFRVEMNQDVDNAATPPALLPFGFEAPLRFHGFTLTASTDAAVQTNGSYDVGLGAPGNLFVGNADEAPDNDKDVAGDVTSDVVFSLVNNATVAGTCSFEFPMTPLRQNSRQGNLSSPKDAYFGIDTTMGTNTRLEDSFKDMGRAFPSVFATTGDPTLPVFERPYIFTLEDLSRHTSAVGAETSETDVFYLSGSRAAGRSMSSTGTALPGDVTGWNGVLRAGFDKFTVPLQGGFDGLDITEADPFRNQQWAGNGTPLTSYAFNSIKMAVDTCADPEVVECNMMTMPALTNTALTEHIVKTCEDRADALAIIDIEHGYKPAAENDDTEEQRAGDVESAVRAMSERGINSSYGCCYYPWVQARDSESGKTFWCPPSVAAIGTFSSSQQKSELWFAPAGFNRGGLTVGSAGIPIINVKQRLSSQDRDDLYEVNINPIASFPAEGIVIFGQKTLQTTQSALDRINVRRLMIYVKKEISRIAATLLFDQNVQTTWDRFTGQTVPFLNSIMTRLGLSDFKVVLDKSTTTADLIDRNIMYAKIFLKPARAIEFIAIDFVITSTGASFED